MQTEADSVMKLIDRMQLPVVVSEAVLGERVAFEKAADCGDSGMKRTMTAQPTSSGDASVAYHRAPSSLPPHPAPRTELPSELPVLLSELPHARTNE